ncbi:hypothetical protein [Sphaerotilus mobilis]|uniref:Uncharacterized protein n=1 Tax=Sphaerotilus mobilis TaxID=47994 RepID=A0A4Q7LES1_9BURK|nr:hypothetical protein [Sphaerotilus mobilis]RZS52995.1 hypothetical protein EV685_2617 [Sphaerotilus mobilis]
MPAAQSLTATYDTSRWTWTGHCDDTTLSVGELPTGLQDYHQAAKLSDVAGACTLDSYNNAGAPA